MPTVNAQGRKKLFKKKSARRRLDTILRTICAPALTTPSYQVKPGKGLIINISLPARLDPKLDLFLEIEAFGAPEVEGRDGELIAAEIKEELIEIYSDLRFAGWVKVGAEKFWFSTSTTSPSAADIKSGRTASMLAMPLSNVIVGGDDFASKSLHTRTWKILKRTQIGTVEKLIKMTKSDLLGINGFGPDGLRVVEARLADHGLTLKSD